MAVEEIIVKIRANVHGFLRLMGASQEKLKAFNALQKRFPEIMARNTTIGGKFAFKIRQLTTGLRGFRMEKLYHYHRKLN